MWLLCALAQADEGLWLPEQIPSMSRQLASMGLRIPAAEVADPQGDLLGSVVSLGHCTASFVSETGLILTAGHCVSGYVQQAELADDDFRRDGYIAAYGGAEASAGPGAHLYVTERIEDVTDQVLEGVKKRTTDLERHQLIEANTKALIAACEERPDIRCEVASMYDGLTWRLISKRELKDVRLVYVPPEDVWFFGGDEDNWTWPRHTGDIALLRAFVAPDGTSAPYAADNVPYRPETWLEIEPTGVRDGDFVWMAGYPQSTFRHKTAREIEHAATVRYPNGASLFGELIDIFTEHAQDPDAAKRLGNFIFSTANARKSYEGILWNFERSGIVDAKRREYILFRGWVAADKEREKRWGSDIDELDDHLERRLAQSESERLIGMTNWFPQQLRVARLAYRRAVEADKPDLERKSGFQDRDEEELSAKVRRLDRTFHAASDLDVTRLVLERAAESGVAPISDWLAGQGGIEGALSALSADDTLSSSEGRMGLLGKDASALEGMDSAWMDLAVRIEKAQDLRSGYDDAYAGALARLRPRYMEAYLEWKGSDGVYPDANGTLRVSFGHVLGYRPDDAIEYHPVTSLAGVLAKSGDAPYRVSEDFEERAMGAWETQWSDPLLNDVPVDYLTTLDNIGGSSGSPTLNAQGKLVGVAFDRNYQGMAADWGHDEDQTRSIHVDIRYGLWLLSGPTEAVWILDELGIRED